MASPAISILERKLGFFPGELQVPLAVTEDYEESWTRAFNSTDGSTTYVLSGDGELVWKSRDQLNAAAFASVLDEYVTVGVRLRSRVVRLAVRPGELALDFELEPGQGDHLSLFRLRGATIIVLRTPRQLNRTTSKTVVRSWVVTGTTCTKAAFPLQRV